MKTKELKVGIKGADPVKVPLRVAESVDDILELTKNDPAVTVRIFNRGWAIENQERSGARDTLRTMVEEKAAADAITSAVAEKVSGYDPTVVQARTGNRGPRVKNVEIKAAKGGKLSMDDFLAQLKAAGVNVNIADGEAAAAQA